MPGQKPAAALMVPGALDRPVGYTEPTPRTVARKGVCAHLTHDDTTRPIPGAGMIGPWTRLMCDSAMSLAPVSWSRRSTPF
jgi:hypothetical protein